MAVKLTGTLQGLSIDTSGLFKDLDTQLKLILKSGIQAWLTKALSIIPVYSGASRGTLQKLGDKIGYTITVFPVVAIDSKGKLRHIENRSDEGRAASQAEIIQEFPNYGFFWSTSFDNGKHLQYNEIANANLVGFHLKQPGPYNFIAQAEEAFKNDVLAGMKALRFNFQKYVKMTSIRF